ncbi:MAG: hotdog fold thioesterase [Saprospiraceae bacterium]|nr:hotdog fold thioesterase [Saprospiraceae bacterium]
MKLWKQEFTLEGLNQISQNTLVSNLGIQFTAFDDQSLVAEMPVDARTIQPMGLLHGGASVSLAETLGSVASLLCLEDTEKNAVVGLEINANHLKAVTKGKVTGTCRPIRIGSQVHVWEIDIRDEQGNRTCVSRLTIAVITNRK